MLGDTAVAINPTDERYTKFHGKMARLPLLNREIPFILDELADPQFGTGVVKVTPAHDANDFQAGERHNLPQITVMDETGTMNAAAGEYSGLDRFAARRRILADLEEQGLLEKTEPYQHALGRCQRCKTVVEPSLSTQWFVKVKPLADAAIHAVEEGRTRFTPENYTKIYFDWLTNVHDWCISRQLWWGHRIPAWYCDTCFQVTVSREDPTRCAHCQAESLTQDPDVLDTWFSSALWPFSTLGWPDQTKDLRGFYPTSLMITGFDILFFWVARMMMMGIEFMGEVPFRLVYIHQLVRDADKQKMSKTKGNVIDPLVVTEKFGTDAVRFTLAIMAAPGTDIALSEDRMEGYRAFANKIWNAARFLSLSMEKAGIPAWKPPDQGSFRPVVGQDGVVSVEDRWIFSRLSRTAGEMAAAWDSFRFHEAAHLMYHFFWHEFCDWYLELKKLSFESEDGKSGAAFENLCRALDVALRLLHPMMPFITEELWQRLGKRTGSIALASFPAHDPALVDESAESEIGRLQDVIGNIRNMRAEMRVDAKKKVPIKLFPRTGQVIGLSEQYEEAIKRLANLSEFDWRNSPPNPRSFIPPGDVPHYQEFEMLAEPNPVVSGWVIRDLTDYSLGIPQDSGDVEAERAKQKKQIEKNRREADAVDKQLQNPQLLAKAPAEVVESSPSA